MFLISTWQLGTHNFKNSYRRATATDANVNDNLYLYCKSKYYSILWFQRENKLLFRYKKKLYKLIGTCMDCGEHWLIFTLYSTVLYINVQMFKFT
jgi:hypothetical protein